jgi:hypothetical protein
MKKYANQNQSDTDIENRKYDTPLQRPPRHDLRRQHAPLRDPDIHSEKIKKRKDMGGTSVYESKKKEAQKELQVSSRSISGFEPKIENLQGLISIETKLDVCLKYLSQAMAEFIALKSIDVSPDGKLGGKGFIMEIPEMRECMYDCVESISCLIDTLYDETRAKHWDCFKKPEVASDQSTETPEDKVAYLLRKAIKNS